MSDGESEGARRNEGAPELGAGNLDEPVDLSDVHWTDAFALLIFWALALVVGVQFFTRYVLNDSIGWTEEIARYLLIGVTFFGATIAVRKNTHISVEFFYRYLPGRPGRVLSSVVDIIRIMFFGMAAWITFKLALKTNQKMTSIELSKKIIYYSVVVAFVVMTIYAIAVAWRHYRSGDSDLIRRSRPRGID